MPPADEKADAKARKMASLAASLQEAHPELDGTFATLGELERLVSSARQAWNDDLLAQMGAYLGEVVRARVPECRWMDFDTALLRAPSLAQLGRGPDLEAVLEREGSFVFPLAKVLKFLRGGDRDSLVAYAPVAVSRLRPAGAPRERRVDPDSFNERQLAAIQLIDAFLANPRLEELRALRGASTHLHDSVIRWVLGQRRVNAGAFTALFKSKAEGRGAARIELGMVAARWLWRAVDAGAVDSDHVRTELEGLLGSSNKLEQQRAAWTLARMGFHRGDAVAVLELQRAGTTPVRVGVLEGLRSHINDAVMGRAEYDSVTPHAAHILEGIGGPAAVRKAASRVVQQVAVQAKTPISPLLPGVRILLEQGKPEEVEDALQALTAHVHAVKHGRASWEGELDACIPLVLAKAQTDPARRKPTKVRIAASYTIRALSSLGERLPEQWREPVEMAFAANRRVR